MSRHGKPQDVIHDQGGRFMRRDFQDRLEAHNFKSRPRTAKNPQANSVCERMHEAIGNTHRVRCTWDPPRGVGNAKHRIETVISDTVYAARCIYNSALKTTQGGLALSRDMILKYATCHESQYAAKTLAGVDRSTAASGECPKKRMHMIINSENKCHSLHIN
jgi:hypothetical protein